MADCFLFCELDGAAALWESEPEAMGAAVAALHGGMRAALERHGGALVKTLPEGGFARFAGGGAVACAQELLELVAGLAWPGEGAPRLRLGIHAGEAVAVGGDYFGPTINKAARIMQAAAGGQALLSGEALAASPPPPGRRALSLGFRRLKDLDLSFELFELAPSGAASSAFPPPASLEGQLHNLPAQASGFVGREEEIARVRRSLEAPACRLLTLVGPGGFGKTRLALKAAESMAPQFPDGRWLVALQAVADAAQIPTAVAQALGLELSGAETPERAVLRHLAPRRTLLLFDNLEHLQDGFAFLEAILREAPHARILATSRILLNLPSETALPLQGLGLPREDGSDLGTSDSGRLLLQALKRSAPGLELKDAEKAAAAGICRLLSGSPLGLELAGAWARTLPLHEIAREIRSDPGFLSEGDAEGQGRRNLAAMLDWTWRRLEEGPRSAMEALSVFAGGFDPASALAVAGADTGLLEALSVQALLRAEDGGRRSIHELVRQHARARLALDPGRQERLLRAHSRHFLGLVAANQADLDGGNVGEASRRLAPDLDNLRAAWAQACRTGDRDALERGMQGFYKLIEHRMMVGEGLEAFALAAGSLPEAPQGEGDLLKARMQADLAAFHVHRGDLAQAGRLLERCLAVFRAHGLLDDIFFVLNKLSDMAEQKGDFIGARDLALQSMAELSWRGQVPGAWPLTLAGNAFIGLGEWEDAEDMLRAGLQAYRHQEDPKGISWVLNILGYCQGLRGDLDGSWRCYQESLDMARASGNPISEAWTLLHVGEWHGWRGDFPSSQQSFEQGLGLHRHHGIERGVAWGLERYARVLELHGDPTASRFSYLQALEPARRAGNQAVVAFCSAGLARLEARLRQATEAERHLRIGRDAAQRSGSRRYLAMLEASSAAVLFEQGRPEEAAREAFRAARRPQLEHDQRRQLQRLLAALLKALGARRYVRLRDLPG